MLSASSYPLTLLSPARDTNVAKAAIQAGADAVYIGAPRFGARQAAGNTIDDIAALAEYAHGYGVKVLVTLNTLLHEDEFADAVAQGVEEYVLLQSGLGGGQNHADSPLSEETVSET